MKRADMDDGRNLTMFLHTDDIRRFLVGNMILQLERTLVETEVNRYLTERSFFETLTDQFLEKYGMEDDDDPQPLDNEFRIQKKVVVDDSDKSKAVDTNSESDKSNDTNADADVDAAADANKANSNKKEPKEKKIRNLIQE